MNNKDLEQELKAMHTDTRKVKSRIGKGDYPIYRQMISEGMKKEYAVSGNILFTPLAKKSAHGLHASVPGKSLQRSKLLTILKDTGTVTI